MSRKTKNTIIFLWIYFLGSPNGNKQAKSESKIPQFRYKSNGLTVIHVFDIYIVILAYYYRFSFFSV
jgi:hypothetical protein